LNRGKPLILAVSYTRILEILAKPALLSCIPDPDSTCMFISLKQGNRRFPAWLEFEQTSYEEWRETLGLCRPYRTSILSNHFFMGPQAAEAADSKINFDAVKEAINTLNNSQLSDIDSEHFDTALPSNSPSSVRNTRVRKSQRLLSMKIVKRKAASPLSDEIDVLSVSTVNCNIKQTAEKEKSLCKVKKPVYVRTLPQASLKIKPNCSPQRFGSSFRSTNLSGSATQSSPVAAKSNFFRITSHPMDECPSPLFRSAKISTEAAAQHCPVQSKPSIFIKLAKKK
jgi:hypothetical protein